MFVFVQKLTETQLMFWLLYLTKSEIQMLMHNSLWKPHCYTAGMQKNVFICGAGRCLLFKSFTSIRPSLQPTNGFPPVQRSWS